VARGRADWVYIDSPRGRPLRVPQEIKIALEPTGEQEDLGIRGYKARTVEDCYRYHSRHGVQSYELDPLGRVHHTAFLNWIHPLEELRSGNWMVFQEGHDIEFFSAARNHDEIEILSWICEVGRVRGAWTHEIYEVGTKTLLARDYSLGIFVKGTASRLGLPSRSSTTFCEVRAGRLRDGYFERLIFRAESSSPEAVSPSSLTVDGAQPLSD
jgi:acyl-CoA thioesterase FadM